MHMDPESRVMQSPEYKRHLIFRYIRINVIFQVVLDTIMYALYVAGVITIEKSVLIVQALKLSVNWLIVGFWVDNIYNLVCFTSIPTVFLHIYYVVLFCLSMYLQAIVYITIF